MDKDAILIVVAAVLISLVTQIVCFLEMRMLLLSVGASQIAISDVSNLIKEDKK